jgi:hypothetical protein
MISLLMRKLKTLDPNRKRIEPTNTTSRRCVRLFTSGQIALKGNLLERQALFLEQKLPYGDEMTRISLNKQKVIF